MKNINFIKTGMENFCCYIEPMEYEFKNNKVVLITGPNGVGKSSIVDSVQFTFFGETGKGAKSSDVVNNVTGKNCHTYVEFTSQTSDNVIDIYRVDRYVKHSKLGDTVLLFKNDMSKPYKKGHKEVLPEIEKILIPQKLFTNTLLFGQKVKDFFTDLPDSERKEIFRKVLQLDDYVLYYDETSNRIKQSSKELEELEKNITLNTKFLLDTNSRIIITKEDIKNFELRKKEEINSLTNKISVLNDELFELNQKQNQYEKINDLELNRINDELSSVQNEINSLKLEEDNLIQSLTNTKNLKGSEFNSKSKELLSIEELNKTKEISDINISFQNYKSDIQKSFNDLKNNRENCVSKILSNNREIDKNNKEITKLESSLDRSDATCPTCGKELTDDTVKKHLTNTLNNLITSKNNLIEEISNLENLTLKIDEDITDINNLINKAKTAVDEKIKDVEKEYNINCNKIKQKLNEATEKLYLMFNEKKKKIENDYEKNKIEKTNNLNRLMSEKTSLINLLNEKRLFLEKIEKVKSEISLNEMLIKNKEKEEYNLSILENYLSEKERLELERKNLDEDKSKIEDLSEILNFWKNGFSSSGIPSLLIDESIPFLNTTVSNYLDLVGGRYKASFDTISTTKSGEYRDKINVNVLDTQTKANNRKQLSGGQTRIIDIAILLSLCDLQNNIQDMKTNILLLDEIFDSLDDQNIGYVSSLLRTLVKDKSINIISHRHIDSIEADEVMRLF
jgi:DNA repair exonuclease SbcCD ATPase subunit